MHRRIITAIAAVILICIMVVMPRIPQAKATATIYIRFDGSVNPFGSPLQRNGNLYTLSENVSCDADGIVVERDNIVLDGAGFLLQGSGSGLGINVSQRSNITIKDVKIKLFQTAIYFSMSSNSNITNNEIAENYDGIDLWSSSNNNCILQNSIKSNMGMGVGISNSLSNYVYENDLAINLEDNIYLHNSHYNCIQENNITMSAWTGIGIFGSSTHNEILNNYIANNTMYNIRFHESTENTIARNIIVNNVIGIQFDSNSNRNNVSGNSIMNNENGARFSSTSIDNIVYNNNFINNTVYHVNTKYASNILDGGYPSGGNYWSGYNGTDVYSGPNQNETGNDGIGDAPYAPDISHADRYSLKGLFSEFHAGSWNSVPYYVSLISNSTISGFSFNATQKLLTFNITEDSITDGFCRIAICTTLLSGPYNVWIDVSQVLPSTTSNGTHLFLYIAYSHGTHNIRVVGTSAIPELSSVAIVAAFAVTGFTVVVKFLRRKMSRDIVFC